MAKQSIKPLGVGSGPSAEVINPLSGQVCGRIDQVKPVAQIIRETVDEFFATIGSLSAAYAR
ncbi:MAG: hypothetical protein ACLQDV_18010 [Candidatus Binataceae bacterium]